MRVLSQREVNRATLARQGLLERTQLDPVDAVERLAGLQAQEPASPYLALWARLDAFDATSLDEAITARRLVKGTLMRATLHLVSVEDYRHFLPAVRPMLQGLRQRSAPPLRDEADLHRLAEAALRFADSPRHGSEVRDHLGELEPTSPAETSWWRVRRQAAFLHAPTGVAWSYPRRPRMVAARAWLPDAVMAEDGDAVAYLARHYLAAFGPATLADMAAWSGQTVARLRPRVEAIPDLVRFRDERGRTLYDLADAPRPDVDTPAPVRLLPMWDSVLLAHADRTRIVSDVHRRAVVATNGDVAPTFLVDGQVAGLWWVQSEFGAGTRIVFEEFGPLRTRVRRELRDEAERLGTFLAPYEPGVYRRYRSNLARRGLQTS